MEEDSAKELRLIIGNNTAGSTELLLMLNGFFLRNFERRNEFGNYIAIASGKLSTFAAVDNYLKDLSLILEKSQDEVRLFLLGVKDKIASTYSRLYENAKHVLGGLPSVVTISNSSTLKQIFKMWHEDNPEIKVVLMESRPKFEGRILAENLLSFGISVELITDSMAAAYVENSGAVIVGADKVLSNGNVVNKSGSRLLAITARHFNKPFIVLTGKDKFTPNNKYTPEEYPSEEVCSFRHKNLKVTNYYFEEVEKELITRIITD